MEEEDDDDAAEKKALNRVPSRVFIPSGYCSGAMGDGEVGRGRVYPGAEASPAEVQESS